MRLLLVEDDPSTRKMLEHLLTEQGYEVNTCADGETALDCHARDPFPFVVLDLLLPGIDGFEVCRRVRNRADGDQVYILVITSSNEPETLAMTLAAGANDYFAKPVTLALLKVRLAVAERDIVEIAKRRELEEQNAATRSDISNIIRSIPDMLIVLDTEGRIREVNQPVTDVLGFARDELTGQSAEMVFGMGGLERFPISSSQKAVSFHNVELSLRTKDGHEIPALMSGSRMRGTLDPADRGLVCIAKDMSERFHAEERIRTLAYYDVLTGLPNRHLMQERVQAAMESARNSGRVISLLFLDLDRFKQVNDSLGHLIGDRLLCQVSERLLECIRLSDTISRARSWTPQGSVSRFGGDEFTILLSKIKHASDAELVAQRILNALAEPFDIEGHEIYSGASIGIAMFPDDGQDAEGLLRSSDTAMYGAKRQGRGTFRFFDQPMNEVASRRLHLENRLRRALERQELSLHYQPVLDADGVVLRGAEVLIRWKLPGEGFVSPAEFIPIAEETGLIGEIGEWVLRSACAQSSAWRAAGFPPIRLSVNLSTRQLRQESLVWTVLDCLSENDLSPEHLELEITETAVMQEDATCETTLRALADAGIALTLDDFGTGYSSLSYIHRFPIDRIKIDRAFVNGITTSAADAIFTAAIIAMAHTLGLEVVAEGVETQEQAILLAEQGCDELQGYLFSRPIPAEEFQGLLEPAKVDPPVEAG